MSPNERDIAKPGPQWSIPCPHILKGLPGKCSFPNVFFITPPKNSILLASSGLQGLCSDEIVEYYWFYEIAIATESPRQAQNILSPSTTIITQVDPDSSI